MSPHRKRPKHSSDAEADGPDAAKADAKDVKGLPPTSRTSTNPKNPKNPPKAHQHQHSGDDDDMAKRRTLFVRSLPYSVTSAELSTRFSFVAPLKHAMVVVDPATKVSRGFGFVTFAQAEDAQRALAELAGADFGGRRIKVEVAQPRHREQTRADGATTGRTKKEEGEEGEGEEERGGVKKRAPRLIVRNLPWSVRKAEQLVKVFQSYGKVKDVIIPKKKSGEMCGFAFVTMRGYRNAQRAMEMTNGKEIDGRPVAVDWAIEKEDYQKRVGEDEEEETGEHEGKGSPEIKMEEDSEDGEGLGDGSDGDEEDDDDDDEEEDEDEDEDEDEEENEDEDADADSTSITSIDSSEKPKDRPDSSRTTLFIRNLPFSTTDESLAEHFSQFGPVRYARVVIDPSTDRPRGTGFVALYTEELTDRILRAAPRDTAALPPSSSGSKHSILQSEAQDPTGQFTLDGRILSVTRAVDRTTAANLQSTSAADREKRTADKRRLYLLQEGAIHASSAAFQHLSASDRHLRDASVKQRRALLQNDPNLHLSFTRLSVRNLPRWVTDKDLKALARAAIPGFAEEAARGLRAPVSREEAERDGDEGRDAERRRREKGVGVVKQAKVQLEKTGGRSRGYGFVEYWRHREALMGLRWLNGREVPGVPPSDDDEAAAAAETQGTGKKNQVRRRRPNEEPERKKRIIVEFALENAKVVVRRKANEHKSREIARDIKEGKIQPKARADKAGKKRKRDADEGEGEGEDGATPTAKKRFRKDGKDKSTGKSKGRDNKGKDSKDKDAAKTEAKKEAKKGKEESADAGSPSKKSYQQRKDEKRAAAGIIRNKRMQRRAKKKAGAGKA